MFVKKWGGDSDFQDQVLNSKDFIFIFNLNTAMILKKLYTYPLNKLFYVAPKNNNSEIYGGLIQLVETSQFIFIKNSFYLF
jgi:hypothetical protein